jgi:mannitol/fructose-specific phosphotransferase system IIA component (Ntr-type)
MNVLDYLSTDNIVLGLRPKTKRTVISVMLEHLVAKNKISKSIKKDVLKAVLHREDMGSTAIGNHIALPHARVASVKEIVICIGLSPEGIDFDSLDQEPVNIIALLLSNREEAGLHLKVLAFLARMLRDKYLVQGLKNAKSQEEAFELLRKQQQAVG